jgi:hypothetical protein
MSKNRAVSFSKEAMDIIDTFSTINDKITVIYAKEFQGYEYSRLLTTNENLLNHINFNKENTLYILCLVEDEQENTIYVLHEYEKIKSNYSYIDNKIINTT